VLDCFFPNIVSPERYQGYRHGTGKRWSANGSVYEGNWRFNKPHGRGKASFANGDHFVGEYVKGCRQVLERGAKP
jgi:hypothetical protein